MMKLSAALLLAPAVVQAFFLYTTDVQLSSIVYIRTMYRAGGAVAGGGDGGATFLGVTVNKDGTLSSTSDLGKVFFKADLDFPKGYYRSAFSNLQTVGAGDLTGPFAVENNKLVYKGKEKAAWSMCTDNTPVVSDQIRSLYLTTVPIPPDGCDTNFDLFVPKV